MESSCARMELSERNLPGSKQSMASAVRSRKMTKKICRLPLTSSALSDPVAGWEPISTNSHHHATLKEHKKQPRFCVVLTRAGAVPVLNLREKRASNRPSVLKPFFRRFFGGGQPSGPHQSRKSQAFVKSPPPFSPFSSIVTPYIRPRYGRPADAGLQGGWCPPHRPGPPPAVAAALPRRARTRRAPGRL